VSYRLDIRPEAEDDIRSAARWYEGERAGLGVDFTEVAYTAIDSLADNALLYRVRCRRRGREIRWLSPPTLPLPRHLLRRGPDGENLRRPPRQTQ
jgi:plasmid stabilization system protein ParE